MEVRYFLISVDTTFYNQLTNKINNLSHSSHVRKNLIGTNFTSTVVLIKLKNSCKIGPGIYKRCMLKHCGKLMPCSWIKIEKKKIAFLITTQHIQLKLKIYKYCSETLDWFYSELRNQYKACACMFLCDSFSRMRELVWCSRYSQSISYPWRNVTLHCGYKIL